MSAEAVGYVYRHSPYSGAAFAVHLAMADSVNDQHEHRFWMAATTLALKARCTRSTAVEALGRLREDGFVEVLTEGRGKPVEYRFLFPDAEVVYETRRGGVPKSDTLQIEGVGSPVTGCTEIGQGVSSEPTQTQENPTKPKRLSAPTDDYVPTEAHRTYAAKHGLDLDDEREAWIVWCKAVGRKYEDVNAGLSYWLRQSKKRGNGRSFGFTAPKAATPDYVGPAPLPRCLSCGALKIDCSCLESLAESA